MVTSGLEAKQRIVTSANFLIDSESQLQAAAGPQDATAIPVSAGASNAAAQVKIDFSTRPNPPSKGSNQVTVSVTEANGAASTGADVSATFFMPAMPAMGMPAMHASAHLNEVRAGTYSGVVGLNSGGTWQVTITVKRNGQVVGVKSASVDAAGGM